MRKVSEEPRTRYEREQDMVFDLLNFREDFLPAPEPVLLAKSVEASVCQAVIDADEEKGSENCSLLRAAQISSLLIPTRSREGVIRDMVRDSYVNEEPLWYDPPVRLSDILLKAVKLRHLDPVEMGRYMSGLLYDLVDYLAWWDYRFRP